MPGPRADVSPSMSDALKLPPLSVLDLVTVSEGATTASAIADSKRLVDAADRLGYRRYWVAEHHNTELVASTSPAVLLAHLGAGTTRIRLGSGGVMLPNHSPLIVAEQFGLLEAMHPGRIDLGLGRAPGTDPITAAAVRGSLGQRSVEDFPQHVVEVLGLLGERRGQHDAEWLRRIRATPVPGEHVPEVWVLGSSLFGAELAAALGLPYAYANHFGMGANPVSPVEHYRRHYTPSERWPDPHVLMSASVIVADTVEKARRLAMPSRIAQWQIRMAKPTRVQSPEQAAATAASIIDQEVFGRIVGTQVVGPAEQAARQLAELAARTGADELLLAATTFDMQTRLDTLEALASFLPAATGETPA